VIATTGREKIVRQAPHKAPVMPKRMQGSIGSRDLVAAPNKCELPSMLAATAVPDNVSADETNCRLLTCSETFSDKAFSSGLDSLKSKSVDMSIMRNDEDFAQGHYDDRDIVHCVRTQPQKIVCPEDR
jgi:poly-gamma-glutamate capsule biosynthesis protein CapA/YwtB (metallophosphatase superfamily)